MAQAKLVIVGGSLATGKTTLAKKISDHTGFTWISKDAMKEALFDVIGYRNRQWSREVGALAFPLFVGVVEMFVSRGESIVTDAPLICESDIGWLNSLVEKHGVQIKQVHLTANPDVLRQRFIDRANTDRHPGHNDALETVLEEFDKKYFSKTFIPLPIKGETKIVDTTDFEQVNDEDIYSFIFL